MTTIFALGLILAATTPAAAASSEVPLTRFALDLYARVRSTPGNLAVSPFSIASALVPLADGARGETRLEIERVLGLDHPWPESRDEVLQALRAAGSRSGGGVEVLSANGLWVDGRVRLLPSYVNALKSDQGTRLAQVDFVGHAEAAAAEINRFVSDTTRGMIPKLVDRLDPKTRLFLANAVYFKGLWASPFPKEATAPRPFRAPGRTAKHAPFMTQKGSFRYAEDGATQALEMPYAGGAAAMLLLLPRADDGLPALEKRLDAAALDTILGEMRRREVEVVVPRFHVASTLRRELLEALGALGLRRATTEEADFSGMTGGRDLFVSEGVHEAVVDVDERGTEAAAATGIGMQVTSAPPPPVVFRADHPFVFLIRDVPTGTILFIGRVEAP